MNSDFEEAVEAAERVRRSIERECSPERSTFLKRRVTVSLGLVSLTGKTRTLEQLIESADRQMYRAKQVGKNRVSSVGGGQEFNASS
jgi:diguanylate cyclase (GGDEF)-like protein